MIDTSPAYKAAITADARRIFAKAVIDLISPDITYGTVTADTQSDYSKPTQLHNKNFDTPKRYATLEKDRWALDGTFDIFPDNPADLTDDVGFIGDSLCDGDGVFSSPAWVQLNFSNVSVLQACSVWFSADPLDGYAVDFTIEVKQGGTTYFSQTVTGNRSVSVSFEGFTVYNPDAIRVTVTKWSIPFRRLRAVEIVPGIYEQWTNDILASLDISQEVNFSCLSLPYGTCTLSMDNLSRRFEPRSKSGLFQSIEERQGIPLSLGVETPSGTEWVPAGIYYQKSGGWTTGNNGLTMQWDLVDIVGLLADRAYIPPATLPTTLNEWAQSLVAQLGVNFADRCHVDPGYSALSITATLADIQGKTCGEILRFACMATGTFPRADQETGKLTIEPMWSAGNYITLDNMSTYPTMSANEDLAAVIFKLHDGADTIYTVSGNNAASSQTISVDNPFIKTTAQALTAARSILSCYGGNKIEISSRGDMASELGDVDSVQLNESVATSARRTSHGFNLNGGVMKDLPVLLVRPDGGFLYQQREIIKTNGTWTAPAGVTSLRIIVVGGGDGGVNGTDGTWDDNGEKGADGLGAKVYSATININSGQTFSVSIGQGGAANGGTGTATTFGSYSSDNGQRFNGYTDIANGDVFGRDGVGAPLVNSGDGGRGGEAGRKGVQHTESVKLDDGSTVSWTVTDAYPTPGGQGVAGQSGCVVVYYDK